MAVVSGSTFSVKCIFEQVYKRIFEQGYFFAIELDFDIITLLILKILWSSKIYEGIRGLRRG